MTITVNEGTQTVVNTAAVGGTETQVVRIDVGSGTATAEFGGTITTVDSVTSIANVVKGTVTKVEGGTIVADNYTFRHGDAFATVISSGTSVLGTIKAAVSGSAIYITDLIISATSATDVEIGDGGTSTPIVGTLHFGADGGMVCNFRTPISTTSGSALVYKQSADVGLTITCTGYVD